MAELEIVGESKLQEFGRIYFTLTGPPPAISDASDSVPFTSTIIYGKLSATLGGPYQVLTQVAPSIAQCHIMIRRLV